MTEIPQCSRATPEGHPADIDQAAEAASERKTNVEISDAEDFATGVRDPDERPESDDEGGATNEDASEEQAPNTEPNEAVIAEFLTTISNYAKRATEGMNDPGMLQLSRIHPDAKGVAPQRFEIGDVEGMTKAACREARNGFNVYIEGRTVRRDLKGSDRGKLDDTVAVFALNIDSVPVQPALLGGLPFRIEHAARPGAGRDRDPESDAQ